MNGDVVFTFSTETLADAEARGMMRPPDRLLQRLVRDPGVGRLVVCDPFRSGPVTVARRANRRRNRPGAELPVGTHVRPMRVRRQDPTAVPELAATYRAYDRRLRAASARAGCDRPAVITFNPFVAAFCPLEWAGSVTFYARDDWASFPPRRAWWPAFEHAYALMRVRRTRVCAVSQALLARLGPTGPSIVVPNGIDPAEWIRPSPLPAALLAFARPWAAYVGTIDDRLDVDAVRAVASSLGDGSVFLVGPCTDDETRDRLTTIPGVHLMGPRGRDDVVDLLRHVDLGVVPHRRTALTEAMSPLKLYEYLAAGLPVAATDLPPMRIGEPGVVLIGPGDDLSAAVETALRRGRMSEADRLRFVRDNDWDRRFDAVLALADPSDDQLVSTERTNP